MKIRRIKSNCIELAQGVITSDVDIKVCVCVMKTTDIKIGEDGMNDEYEGDGLSEAFDH